MYSAAVASRLLVSVQPVRAALSVCGTRNLLSRSRSANFDHGTELFSRCIRPRRRSQTLTLTPKNSPPDCFLYGPLRSRIVPTKKGHRKGVLFVGGDKRDRTADLLNAIQALSQLSYTPMSWRRPLLYHILCLLSTPFLPPKKFLKNFSKTY